MPDLYEEIADVIGVDAAECLAKAYGGTEMFIPQKVDNHHWLSRCIGHLLASRLAEHFSTFSGGAVTRTKAAGAKILMPRYPWARQYRAWCQLEAQARSVPEIALALGVHIRTVYRWRRAYPDVYRRYHTMAAE